MDFEFDGSVVEQIGDRALAPDGRQDGELVVGLKVGEKLVANMGKGCDGADGEWVAA